MNNRPIEQARSATLHGSWPALLRAAQRAREVAERTGTELIVSRNGAIEGIQPELQTSLPVGWGAVSSSKHFAMGSSMPTISVFYGIVIQMFWDEHAPPHFHATYGEFKATVNIRELAVSEGDLPRRARQLVLDWAELHQQELLADWDLCQANQHPVPIEPLK